MTYFLDSNMMCILSMVAVPSTFEFLGFRYYYFDFFFSENNPRNVVHILREDQTVKILNLKRNFRATFRFFFRRSNGFDFVFSFFGRLVMMRSS